MEEFSIKDIEQLSFKEYVGYLWWSDQEKPEIIDGNAPQGKLAEGTNPFVVEGQLYNKTEDVSYSIKYVDGKHVVRKYTGMKEDMNNKNHEVKEYLSNRMDGKWLKFLRYWEDVPSTGETSNEWPVLTQTKNVFIGFKI